MKIRLWKLGHLDKEFSVYPTEDAFNKLNKMLAALPPGDVADIIWGPDITCEVIDTGDDKTQDVIIGAVDETKLNNRVKWEVQAVHRWMQRAEPVKGSVLVPNLHDGKNLGWEEVQVAPFAEDSKCFGIYLGENTVMVFNPE